MGGGYLIIKSYTKNIDISNDCVNSLYYVKSAYVRSDSIEGSYIWATCFCNTTIKSTEGIGAIKSLSKQLNDSLEMKLFSPCSSWVRSFRWVHSFA